MNSLEPNGAVCFVWDEYKASYKFFRLHQLIQWGRTVVK